MVNCNSYEAMTGLCTLFMTIFEAFWSLNVCSTSCDWFCDCEAFKLFFGTGFVTGFCTVCDWFLHSVLWLVFALWTCKNATLWGCELQVSEGRSKRQWSSTLFLTLCVGVYIAQIGKKPICFGARLNQLLFASICQSIVYPGFYPTQNFLLKLAAVCFFQPCWYQWNPQVFDREGSLWNRDDVT